MRDHGIIKIARRETKKNLQRDDTGQNRSQHKITLYYNVHKENSIRSRPNQTFNGSRNVNAKIIY